MLNLRILTREHFEMQIVIKIREEIQRRLEVILTSLSF